MNKRLWVQRILGLVPFFLMLALVSCGGSARTESSIPAEALKLQSSMPSGERLSGESSGPSRPASYSPERKLIHTATLTIQVEDLSKTLKEVEQTVSSNRGYLSKQESTEESVVCEIRVPQDVFQSTISALEPLGTLRSKTITAQDVSEQYYDLEEQIKNKRVLVQRYREYLQTAKNIEEILKVEEALNNVTLDLERLEGSFAQLSRQITYATIHLVLIPRTPPRGVRTSFWDRAQGLLSGYLDTFQTILLVLLGVIVYGIPLVLILAGLYWVGFGRLGLVRKLFARLRSPKNGGG